ncbi:MAG: DUF411 domain-containing protein [Rhodospirillaceae bacterium]|jgi:hypothetical protein|nr:DUF411 domain-containing protein [Rhodospirillaceae bacterium]
MRLAPKFMILAWLLAAPLPAPAQAAEMTVYKSPSCGCCGNWVKHMEAAGHQVKVVNTEDMDAVKAIMGVPEPLHSCHTASVDGYLLEGHVPAKDVDRLLAERPKALGLAVPGMPTGSPGMEMPGTAPDRYEVILFTEKRGEVFSRY